MRPVPKDKDKVIDKGNLIPEQSCVECNVLFIPRNKYVRLKFCSRKCAITNHWKNRERKEKKVITKKCLQCGNDFVRNPRFSDYRWGLNKFCSCKCSGESQRINDGLSKYERLRRKRGSPKQFTPEWLEKIRARTKEGMMRPDVQEKLHKPKGPLSLAVKMKLSDVLAGVMPKNMIGGGTYSNIQRGTYDCSKGPTYFRSKWEANYALYLDFLVKQGEIVNWEFEADMFFFEKIQLGTRSYTPDFKVFNNDGSVEYHEVKGYMDSKSKTKLKRMEKYFPEIKVILIQSDFYSSIIKKLKGIIKFY